MAAVSNESSDSLSLNLMPMLDIFSILITFLLMSFSTDPVNYNTNAGVELPESLTMAALDETPSIIVSKTEVKVNDKVVSTITAGDVPASDQQQGAVYPVFQELEKLMEANKRALKGRVTELDKGRLATLTMEMDSGHRFKLMKRIMLAAQQAEFITFKLMVSKQSS